jgi:pimeloyl-ACP methyl ester carboxylesterase/DNA-binding SARP family transcriptional activator
VAFASPIRYAHAGAVSLAFQVFGTGERDVMVIPAMAHNIETMWERWEFRRVFEGMGRFCRVVHFDKRGTGASDRTVPVPTLDERVDDARAVMDAAGLDRCFMYGLSEGGPMAALFAATYPERVAGLILHATAARFVPDDESVEERDARRDHVEQWVRGWGTEDTTTLQLLAPTAAADPSYRAWEPRFERQSATPAGMRDLIAMWEDIDVREVLPTLSVPTLVMSRRNDPSVPIENARAMATAIPGARFVELDGADHWAHIGDVDQWLDAIEPFITGVESAARPPANRRAASPHTDICTFGGFRIVRNGDEVPLAEWGSRRARVLCKRLAAAGGEPVPRDVLFELLWPDDPEPSKLGPRLSVQLSVIRRILGGGVIADRAAVRLDLDTVSLDLAQFRTAVSAGRLADAVAIHSGPFLPEDAYEPWTDAPRDRSRAAYLSALGSLAEEAARCGDHVTVVDLMHCLLEADPYNSGAHLRLIAALDSDGQHGAAQQARDRYGHKMRELGISET